jgi:pyruvate/2-oxoglutarate dehydrogenase complex dihydrolipoamide dehydrogenase (E3) component
LFRLPAKENRTLIPWVTYTDPELAHVGLSEDEARKRHKQIKILRWPYVENDRAQAERRVEGFIKVTTDKKGKILGATIVGEAAGELIQLWALALAQGLNIRAMTGFVSPYPTLSEISKRAAITYYTDGLKGVWVQRAIRFLRMFG